MAGIVDSRLGEREQRQRNFRFFPWKNILSIIVEYPQETDPRRDLEKFRIWEMFYLHFLENIYREVKCPDVLFRT